MNEWTLQYIQSGKIIWLAVFGLLYGLGGINGKYLRRIIGSLWLVSGICLFSWLEGAFSWWYVSVWPMLWIALSMGYGAVGFWKKVQRRIIYGLCLAIAFLPVAIINGSWMVFGAHTALCIFASFIFGVFNPVSARAEETLIATAAGLLPLFMFS
jgi:hypothetical protein